MMTRLQAIQHVRASFPLVTQHAVKEGSLIAGDKIRVRILLEKGEQGKTEQWGKTRKPSNHITVQFSHGYGEVIDISAKQLLAHIRRNFPRR